LRRAYCFDLLNTSNVKKVFGACTQLQLCRYLLPRYEFQKETSSCYRQTEVRGAAKSEKVKEQKGSEGETEIKEGKTGKNNRI